MKPEFSPPLLSGNHTLQTLARAVEQSPASVVITDALGNIEYVNPKFEAVLRESERMDRSTLDSLSAHIAILDHTGTILAVNRAWREFAEENPPVRGAVCEGANYWQTCEAVEGEDAATARAFAEGIRAVLEGRQADFCLEYACHSPTEQRWFVGRVTRCLGEGPLRVVVAHENITERRQAEAALQESESKFRSLFQTMAEGVALHELVCDADGRAVDYRMLDVNPAFARHTGLAAEGVRGQLGSQVFGSTPAPYLEVYERAVRTGEGCSFATFYPPLQRHFEVSVCSPSQGRFATVFTDITERKRTEARILESETRFREQASLLDLTQDGIVVRDLEGRVRYWNKGNERIVGWTAEEMMGRRMDEVLKVEETFAESVLNTLLEKGEWSGEANVTAKDGQVATLLSCCTLVRDPQGQPTSVLAISTNITEKKKLEAQFLRAQRLESIGQLAGGIAHDLNNILAPMMLILPMVRGEATSPDTQGLLDSLETSVRRGADMVRQILTFSRGLESAKAPLQSRHIVRECAHLAQETFPKTITLQARFASDLWLIEADATQMHQVFMNLAVNARDAMPLGGKLTLAAENRVLDERQAGQIPHAKAGPYVVWRVSDTGSGIAPEILDRIFDPFFTTKEVGKGTGLGLSTVLGIVRNHHGFIQVQSKVGQGTEFEVYLPAIPTSVAAAETPHAAPIRGEGEWILVVEDEAPLREATRKTLENFGYRTMAASDGIEALALFDQHRSEIRAVLADLMMPKLDGLAVIRVLKQIAPQIPVVVCSGIAEEDHAAELDELGVREFLEKPFSAFRLLEALDDVLRR